MHNFTQSCLSRRRGFSLVEVMIALAIFGAVTAGVLGVLVQGSRSGARTLERSQGAEILKQAFIILNVLAEENKGDVSLTNANDIQDYFPMEFTRDGLLVGSDGQVQVGDDILSQPFYLVTVERAIVLRAPEYGAVPAVGLELKVEWPIRSIQANRSELTLSNVVTFK